MQWYLAAELRDRIRESGVRVRIVDRQARKEYDVEPRQFSGRLLHDLPRTSTEHGDVYVELHLGESEDAHGVGLYRRGTRVLTSITELDIFNHSPWTDGYLQGVVDAPFLNLTPGTRTGVVHDQALAAFRTAMGDVGAAVSKLVEEQRQAEEEQATRQTLRTIQRAFREALLALPAVEYDWFDIGRKAVSEPSHRAMHGAVDAETVPEPPAEVRDTDGPPPPKSSSSGLPDRCTRKLRYIARLYAKELVYKNFPGMPTELLLERLIELSLYTEEHLK